MAKFHVILVRQQQFIERVEIERYPEAEIHHEIQLTGRVNSYWISLFYHILLLFI